jgi:hypothetical protein
MIKTSIWTTLFGDRMKKLRPNQDTSSCKIGSSDLGNRKFRFWPKQRSNRLRDRIRFSFDSFPFRVRFLVERAKTSRLYICRLRPIVKNPSINRSIQFYLLSCLYPSFFVLLSILVGCHESAAAAAPWTCGGDHRTPP